MKVCQENVYKVTVFNSLLCSFIRGSFIFYLLFSISFFLALFLVLSNIRFFIMPQIYQSLGFNFHTLVIIIPAFLFNISIVLISYSFIFGQYNRWSDILAFFLSIFLNLYVVGLVMIVGGFLIYPYYSTYSILNEDHLLEKPEYIIIFIILFIVWIYIYLFFTYIGEKNQIKTKIKKENI